MTTDSTSRTYSVPDISCDHCKSSIEQSVGAVANVSTIVVDLEAKTVSVTGGDDQEIIAAIDDAGYDVAV